MRTTSILLAALLVSTTSAKGIHSKMQLAQSKSHSKIKSRIQAKSFGQNQINAHASAQARMKAKAHAKTKIKTRAYLRAWSKVAEDCVNGEGVDSYDDGCDWYDANPESCGDYDWESFTAADECCVCGGGGEESAEEEEADDGECVDGEGVDSFGDGCDWYDENVDGCGAYDTADFVADEQCCACEADAEEEEAGGDECTNGDGVDSYGDGCDWYDANPDGCGVYDTDEFIAADQCCVCEGEEEEAAAEETCTSGDGVDTFGDGCDWYDANPDGCGDYDSADFVAGDQCCACGGSAEAEAEVVEETAGEEECVNGDGVDSFGDGCDWYDANPDGCGSYDTADFVAADQCCVC